MTREEIHVELLKEAYKKWHDTKAGSVDHWLDLMTEDVKFRSRRRRRKYGIHAHEYLQR